MLPTSAIASSNSDCQSPTQDNRLWSARMEWESLKTWQVSERAEYFNIISNSDSQIHYYISHAPTLTFSGAGILKKLTIINLINSNRIILPWHFASGLHLSKDDVLIIQSPTSFLPAISKLRKV